MSNAALMLRIESAPLVAFRGGTRRFAEEHLLRLLDDRAAAARLGALCDASEPLTALIAGVAAHSPFLLRQMRRRPEQLLAILEGDPDVVLAGLLAETAHVVTGSISLEAAMARLRQIRLQMALHVALCDLAGIWDVDRVVAVLTEFADAAVDAALRLALNVAAAGGRLALDDAANASARAGLVILAMGKHGAHELNYSSDIDLIVLFDPAAMPVAAGKEPLDVAVRIVKDVVRVLHEQTGSGYVFRTDLRLRPDPASTPVAVPYDRAVGYYQTVGQNWERAALIKARPVAGDLALG
ncbi:MAG: bifunctional [glutamine synthetase] adenylyltransferase/[glutamine synthetase]-adenylyl-L-tyrosine phosphorylase, partial [Beijerinckiaceae bacterium]